MGILELLSKVGEDNLRLQFINNSVIDVKDKKVTKDTEITFATAEVNTNQLVNDTGKVGIVVWIDREDYNKSI
ncbi:hypothetical protein AXI76_gp174 [Pseudoalteromonas phage H101]|uniref:Uncharacterized protein n=1 Tax=Pseudoalteromonas phage H101 TaxID=1654919 RepID=A0A0H4J2B2_9CAUD|nr:hypothetical protein AXI76_gp174 [Pseudoalteromonas phage H101]AKO61075.1 hypothetical protein [Pseudoalteromonas phage H101]